MKHSFALQGLALAAATLLGTASASAAVYLLDAAGENAVVNFGKFTLLPTGRQPAGSGFFDPFVRLNDNGGDNNGVEEGYNTGFGGGLSYPDATDPFTRNFQLSELRKDTPAGTPANAFVFDLDMNEPGGGAQQYLALTELKIWVNDLPNLNFSDLADFGTPIWDMDALENNAIIFLDIGSGSGESDVEFLLPASALQNIAGVELDDYLYFYSKFAFAQDPEEGGPEGGFEEWAVDTARLAVVEPRDIPEAEHYALLAGLGLIGFGVVRRMRR